MSSIRYIGMVVLHIGMVILFGPAYQVSLVLNLRRNSKNEGLISRTLTTHSNALHVTVAGRA